MLRGALLRIQSNAAFRSEFKTLSAVNDKVSPPGGSSSSGGQDSDRLKTDDLFLSEGNQSEKEEKDEKGQLPGDEHQTGLGSVNVKPLQLPVKPDNPSDSSVKKYSTSQADGKQDLVVEERRSSSSSSMSPPFLGMPVDSGGGSKDLIIGSSPSAVGAGSELGKKVDHQSSNSRSMSQTTEIGDKTLKPFETFPPGDPLLRDRPWIPPHPSPVISAPVQVRESAAAEAEASSAFEAVPGPAPLRVVSKIWSYVPLVGTQLISTFIYSLQNLILSYDKKFRYSGFLPYNYLVSKYGPVVRLHGPIGADIVVIGVDGETIPIIHQTTKGTQGQSMFDTLNEYRKNAPTRKLFKLSLDNVERKPAKSKFRVQPFLQKNEIVTDNFVRRTSLLRSFQDEVTENYSTELFKWSLSCTMEAYFNKQLSFFEEVTDSIQVGESGRLLHALLTATEALKYCESGIQLWRIMPTFSWSSLNDYCATLDGILAELVNTSINELNSGKRDNLSLLQLLLLSNEMKSTFQDILTPLLDVLIINVNVVANSAGFLFYHLARNPLVQRKLFTEIEEVTKSSDKSKMVSLYEMQYLKACIMESIRLKPPFPYLSRLLQEDTVIHGYNLPKGTYIQMVNLAGSRRGILADEWGTFEPERWLDHNMPPGDPLMGLTSWRSAPNINRDLVMTQIALLTYKIVHHFRLEHPNNVLASDGMVLAGPNRAFNLKLSERIRI